MNADTRTVHTRTVPAPGRPDRAPLTWGQRQVYRDMHRAAAGKPYNDGGGIRLPEGLDLDAALDVVVALVQRHESLRTTVGPGSDGALVQRVADSCELRIEVVELPDSALDEVLSLVAAEEERLLGTVFDVSADPLVRPVVFCHRGVPGGVSLAVPKIAADLAGVRLLMADLAALAESAASGRPAPPPPEGRQPFDQALYEQSADGRRVEASALRRIREEYAAFPARLFGPPAEPMPQRYWRGGIVSRAIPMAAGAIAARRRTGTTVVLLAAASAVLAHSAGRSGIGLQLISRNRHAADQRAVVGTVVQNVPAVLRVGGLGFTELLTATWSRTMRAYRAAQFDLARAADVLAEVERSRGETVDADCYFNDTRADHAPGPNAAAADSADIRAAQAETEFRWEERVEHDALSVFVEVFDHPGRTGLMRLCMYVDTAQVPPGLARRMLLAVERLLVEASDRDLSAAEVASLAAVEPSDADRAEDPGDGRRSASWRTRGTPG
ncbi:condensation domain-containing protein [Streptomonospora litoralis]|uniref:Surfactin synthase subunit 1 n=1 Tax=Streptomonospora litoralis TaxID=2498135 RepID=A0A4P6PWR6_9ACTN|nr:condensation domain-containing protein [Streptomonospora litoralis]QBI52628.1 Surfactin synthase subunit 1 [Streptomonospora litoralis]